MKQHTVLAVLLIAFIPMPVFDQQQQAPATDKPISASLGTFVYPKNNQGMEQQKKDEMDCF